MCFLYYQSEGWMQISRWSLTGVQWKGRITSFYKLAMLLCMKPRVWLSFWVASAHCWLFTHRYPQALLFRTTLYPFILLSILISGIVSVQVQELPCWTLKKVIPLCRPSGWYLFSQVHQSCTTVWCHPPTCCGWTQSHHHIHHSICAINKDLEWHCLQYGPLRDSPYCWLPLGHWVIDHNSLDVVIQSISYPSTCLSINPISNNSNLQVIALYGTTSKALEKSK